MKASNQIQPPPEFQENVPVNTAYPTTAYPTTAYPDPMYMYQYPDSATYFAPYPDAVNSQQQTPIDPHLQ